MLCSSCRRAAAALAQPRGALRAFSKTSSHTFASMATIMAIASRRTTTPLLVAAVTTITTTTTRAASTPRPYSSSSSSTTAKPSSRPPPAEDPLPAMTPAEASIAAVLSAALDPTFVLVQDVSGGCGSMYAIQVASRAFRGQTLLRQQRMVNAALGDRVREWHGVQIRTVVPDEDE
ncbi:hypothetical protein JDV02_005529 [Purpureocillium takamizusanense]|uniref:BolA-like protein n=1 Tax=Purpureocillium takamizusanense TaxID=2060973 RepID=A0A9Q8VAF5_9HYPO|nr:uncharacterized protein JDV02_005529 [Purpureocillium takamizusanense]UNI19340.1 hypothetical protein JDV02_005529 [Purpureocillium takamizusanense]